MKESGKEISKEFRQTLSSIFSRQENFSKTRNVEKASVKLRFRIMTEVNAEGNILNPKKYPEIKDNTLNFVLPCHNDEEENNILKKSGIAFGRSGLKQFNIFKIKHHFNGNFVVFQAPL